MNGQSISSKALSSLALMETSLLAQDYLSTFVPFVVTLVLKNDYDTINLDTLVSDFQSEFGIKIPRAPMQSILSRAVAKGIIQLSNTGQYKPDKAQMHAISFLGKQRDAIASVSSLLNNFSTFVSERHGIKLSAADAENILLGFFEEYSPATIAGISSDVYWSEIQSKRNLYLMGEFIQNIYQNNYSLFEIVVKYAMSYLIATALAFDSTEEIRLKEFSNLTLYLDTPVVLRLLGLQTEELENAYKELFSSFNATIKPTYKIFQHTLDEISGILTDCANWIDNPNYNPLYANNALLQFVKKHYNRTQVELYKNSLIEIDLRNLGLPLILLVITTCKVVPIKAMRLHSKIGLLRPIPLVTHLITQRPTTALYITTSNQLIA